MKLITFIYNDSRQRVGVICKDDKTVTDLTDMFYDMNNLIASCSVGELKKYQKDSDNILLSEIKILAPIPEPKQDIICLGINYAEHAEESARFKNEKFDGKRKYPVYFSKRVNEALKDKGTAHCLNADEKIDYEAELGVIISKTCRNVSAGNSRDYVFGYTIINDLSARTLQQKHKQWYYGKSFDSSCPMGPWIVTADEFDYPPKLKIESRVNSEVRQSSNTGKMIFNIDYIIEDLSRSMTLKSASVISTGTPAGAGMGFEPPKFLKDGDKVECEIENIGILTTYISK